MSAVKCLATIDSFAISSRSHPLPITIIITATLGFPYK